jgi:hypothetical protein
MRFLSDDASRNTDALIDYYFHWMQTLPGDEFGAAVVGAPVLLRFGRKPAKTER